MNRFRKAWLALTGRLEPEVRFVDKFANVEEVTVYRVDCSTYAIGLMSGDELALYGRHFLTCDAAFEAIGDGSHLCVEKESAIRVGNSYFRSDARLRVGKPKRPKGVRRG